VRQLSAAQVELGVPVRILGILTYFDGISDYCFVQDSAGGIRVSFAPGQIPPAAGWRVEVAGVASSGGAAPAIVQARITALGAEVLPPAIPVSPSGSWEPEYEYKRVVVSGAVQSVASERPGLVTLKIRADGATIRANVPASTAAINEEWTDADVRASGVLDEEPPAQSAAKPAAQSMADGNPAASDYTLWISDPRAIETTRLGRLPARLPVVKIRSLLALDPARAPAHRVRVQGVSYLPIHGGMAIMDDDGQIPVRMAQTAVDPEGRMLDLAGFLAWEHGRPFLDGAVPVAAQSEDTDHTPAPGSTLTTALQVHRLPLSAAQRAYPVHLRAVVTYFDPANLLLFVQDAGEGIFVELTGKEKLLARAGDTVDITGVTIGDFAPDVAHARIKVLGYSGMPAPKTGVFGSASSGREDCRWIELGGIVQHVAPGKGDALLSLVWAKTSYSAHVLAPPASLAHLVDAEVKLQGVCGAVFNSKHQMLGIQMYVPGSQYIQVLQAPRADPFSMAATPVADLLRYSPAASVGHRVLLRGTVTYPSLSGPTWIRDATGGVMIQDHDAVGLAPGDLVDVLGFPEIVGFGPALRGARVKRLQPGAPPVPVHATAQEAIKGNLDGQLVQIEGKLVDHLQLPAEQVLAVASGDITFSAILPFGAAAHPMEPGTRLRLTGICSVEAQPSYDLIPPRTFRLLLRSPADVVIVGRPPWLTARRVLPILAGAALLTLAAMAWIVLLRKRVRGQTFELRVQTVQLQAAHQKTREALRKKSVAEALDLDSNRILKLIARDEPVDLIVDHIAEAVALHCEGAVCAILLEAPYGPRVCLVPAMPAGWQEALGRIRMSSISFSPGFRDPQLFSDDPAWADFIDSQKNTRFRTFCSAPIVVNAATAGVVAAFFRNEKGSDLAQVEQDAQGAQLGLWCNIAALALDRRRLHDQLSHRAQHDVLTELPNRALLYERLEAEIARASSCGALLGVLYIDLDGFKQINDTYGHGAGDAVLREAASRMTRGLRRGDMVARIGGDEFVVLLPLLGRREDAELIADQMTAALGEPIYSNHLRLSVSACIGLAVWPLDGDRPDPLLQFADARMYGEKKRRWYDAQPKSPGEPPAPPSRRLEIEQAILPATAPPDDAVIS
jgi:diguanylate cyclase (GGDEF)-like protein